MRLWSIHPKYLDKIGLVALWREALLAQKVLAGKTKGYKNHPQLERFKKQSDPVKAIGSYLCHVFEEAQKRGYRFSKEKICHCCPERISIPVSRGQVKYEFDHLKKKVFKRAPEIYKRIEKVKRIASHPVFHVGKGDVESWERISKLKIKSEK